MLVVFSSGIRILDPLSALREMPCLPMVTFGLPWSSARGPADLWLRRAPGRAPPRIRRDLPLTSLPSTASSSRHRVVFAGRLAIPRAVEARRRSRHSQNATGQCARRRIKLIARLFGRLRLQHSWACWRRRCHASNGMARPHHTPSDRVIIGHGRFLGSLIVALLGRLRPVSQYYAPDFALAFMYR